MKPFFGRQGACGKEGWCLSHRNRLRLGADAFNPLAVAHIFAVEQRPQFDPLFVHVGHMDALARAAEADSSLVRRLVEAFWPGPLTLVPPKKGTIVTAGLPTVAVRIADHKLARRLIELAQRPVAAPSANPFGRISPTTAAHVDRFLGDQVHMIQRRRTLRNGCRVDDSVAG